MAFVFEDQAEQTQPRFVLEPEEKPGIFTRATTYLGDLMRKQKPSLPVEDIFRTGVEDVAAPVKQAELPDIVSPIMRGAKAVPSAALEIVKHGGQSLLRAPQFLREVRPTEPRGREAERFVRRVYETPGELLRGVGEAATAGLSEEFGVTPPAETEGQRALRTLGGFAAFPSILKAIGGGAARKIGAGAVMGAAVPAVRGEAEQALESAVTGAGLMAGFELASAAFRRLKGRLPRDGNELTQVMREESGFIKALREEEAARVVQAEKPKAAERPRIRELRPDETVEPVAETQPARGFQPEVIEKPTETRIPSRETSEVKLEVVAPKPPATLPPDLPTLENRLRSARASLEKAIAPQAKTRIAANIKQLEDVVEAEKAKIAPETPTPAPATQETVRVPEVPTAVTPVSPEVGIEGLSAKDQGWKSSIVGKMQEQGAKDLSDAEIARTLESTVGANRLIENAKRLRDSGALIEADIGVPPGEVAIGKPDIAMTKTAEPAPAQAEAKVSRAVQDTASSPKDAKRVKEELASRIEALIKGAPTEGDNFVKAAEIKATMPTYPTYELRLPPDELARAKESYKVASEAWDKKHGKELERLEKGTITIEIPGDGTFKIRRTKEALEEILTRVKGIPTAIRGEFKPKPVPIPKPTGKDLELDRFNEQALEIRKPPEPIVETLPTPERGDDVMIADRYRGTNREPVIQQMLEEAQKKAEPAWSDGDYVWTRQGKFKLKPEGGTPEFENTLSEEGVLRQFDLKEQQFTSSNRVIRELKAEREAGMESRRLAEETRINEGHDRINRWRTATQEREQAYLASLDEQAKAIKFKRGPVEIHQRSGENVIQDGALLSNHFAIRKPDSGQGYVITHRGTGLAASNADTIQHAKRIVAGLENQPGAKWDFTDPKLADKETLKNAGSIGYGMRGRAIAVPELFQPITEPPFPLGEKVVYKEYAQNALRGKYLKAEHEATVSKVHPDGSVDIQLRGKGQRQTGHFDKVSPEDLELAFTELKPTAKAGGRSTTTAGYPEPEPETVGFPEFRKTPKDVPQSITPIDRNFQPSSVTGEESIIRRGDIIRELQDALQVPIRVGHGNFEQMKASGFFKLKEEVIRLKKANNMETASHEIGHYISKKFLEHQFSKLKAGGRQFDKELVQMGRDLYGSRKPNHGYAEEGIAEFVKFYITDPRLTVAKAPKFSKFFDDLLETKFPDLRDTLQVARENWKRYQEQPAVARVLSQISVGEDKPRSITLDGLYKSALDDLRPIKVFTDRMNKGKSPLQPTDDPYTLARLFRGWVGKADLFLKDGPIDYESLRPTGTKPLNEILRPFKDNLDDLRAYLTARRAAELMTRGKETGLSGPDVQATLDIYNNRPEFVSAARELQAYNNSLLDYLQKSGVLSEQAKAAIKELNQEYVPFYRLIEGEHRGAGAAGAQQFADLGSPVKRIKGSAREIIDPLESIVKNTYAMISVADRNAVGQALVRLANSTEGMGKYIEKVPRDKIPVTLKDEELHRVLQKYGKIKETEEFKTSKKEFSREVGVGGETGETITKGQQLIENRIKEALTARGFSEGESGLYIQRLKSAKSDVQINSVIEKIITEQTIRTVTKQLELDLPPEIVAAFRPDPKIPGMDNILSVRFDGKPILYQVHPDLYEAMAGLNRNSTNMLIKILSLPARALRLGATTLSAEFAIRNPIRDQWTAAIYSAYGYRPGIDFIRGIAHVIKNDELYQAWKAGGGEHSMLLSLDRTSLQRTLKNVVQSGEARGILKTIISHPIESLRMLSELGEAGTRMGEFARGIEKQGGLTRENILRSAMASREVTLDFARMGATMKATGANQIIAFLNANMQGIDKIARAFKDNPGPTLAKAAATITVPSLLLYAINYDDPQYTELPRWQKDLFWIIPSARLDSATWAGMNANQKAAWSKDHTVWRIPKPFELGILFGTFPERVADWIVNNDPRAMAEFAKSALSSLPNPIPTGALPLIENMANWSMFRGRRIVPRGKEDVVGAMQYSPFTSEAAKLSGRALGYSPAKIENLVRGWLGGLGQLGLDVASSPLKSGGIPEPEKSLADIIGVRAFVARFPGQPESIERFYNKYADAMEIKNTLDLLRRERKFDEARNYAKEHQDDLVKARRYSNTARSFSVLRRQMDRIRQDKNIDGETKRSRLDALTFRMADLAKRALSNKQESDLDTSPEQNQLLQDILERQRQQQPRQLQELGLQ